MDGNGDGADEKDRLFLERILDKLYDFGSGSKKKQKKRKRKQQDEEEDEAGAAADLSEDLGGGEGAGSEERSGELLGGSVPSVQSHQVEVVTFQDPLKRQRSRQTPAPDPPTQTPGAAGTPGSPAGALTLEQARLEVHRFGITGYKKEQQRVFEQDRAIMLGAQPPKKQYTNYKVLQQQIKEKKQRSTEEVDPDLKKKKRRKSKGHRDKKASAGSDSAPTGHVGRFKNGMLILSSQDIQKVKGKRGSR